MTKTTTLAPPRVKTPIRVCTMNTAQAVTV